MSLVCSWRGDPFSRLDFLARLAQDRATYYRVHIRETFAFLGRLVLKGGRFIEEIPCVCVFIARRALHLCGWVFEITIGLSLKACGAPCSTSRGNRYGRLSLVSYYRTTGPALEPPTPHTYPRHLHLIEYSHSHLFSANTRETFKESVLSCSDKPRFF